MKSRWLRFINIPAQRFKTSMWRVENKKSGDFLGLIKWYPYWRQYCFITNNNIVYAQSCLREIADFIKKLMDKRKKNK